MTGIVPTHPLERVLRICARNGLQLGASEAGLLRAYGELLADWNRKINLISRRDQDDLWQAHILHSLSPWFYVRLPAGALVLDMGTGGGLPGIPLAILRTDLRLVLLDSISKKTAALGEIVRALGLPNVEVRTGRAEESAFARTFRCDYVMARAVASLEDLIRWSRPLLRPGLEAAGQEVPSGTLIALKGGDLEAEIERARIRTGVSTPRVIDLGFDGSRDAGLVDKKLVLLRLTVE